MEAPTYRATRVAEMLGVPQREPSSGKLAYSAEDLRELRRKLTKFPARIGHRKQLFLNFKGGTGKTSLSTAYGYRMTEMGYRVLLVDLDPQAHATKCMGYEGEDFPKTLLDVFCQKVPLS